MPESIYQDPAGNCGFNSSRYPLADQDSFKVIDATEVARLLIELSGLNPGADLMDHLRAARGKLDAANVSTD